MGTAAGIVNCLGDEIDSRPLFPLEQHAARLLGDLLNALSQGLHRLAMSYHVAQITIAELSFEAAIFSVQPRSLTGTRQYSGKHRGRIRLGKMFDTRCT